MSGSWSFRLALEGGHRTTSDHLLLEGEHDLTHLIGDTIILLYEVVLVVVVDTEECRDLALIEDRRVGGLSVGTFIGLVRKGLSHVLIDSPIQGDGDTITSLLLLGLLHYGFVCFLATGTQEC